MKDLKSELAELERAKKGKSPFVQSVIQKKIDRLKSSSSKTSDSGGKRLTEAQMWKILEKAKWTSDYDYKRIGKQFAKLPENQQIQLFDFYNEKYWTLYGDNEKYWLKNIELGDDSYGDLIAEVVGRGKTFYNNIKPKDLKAMADARDFEEKFGYAFQELPWYSDYTYDISTGKSKITKAKGGMVEHGLKRGDKITDDMFWDDSVVVDNKGKKAVVDLNKGKRIESMGSGGKLDPQQKKAIRSIVYNSEEDVPTIERNLKDKYHGEDYQRAHDYAMSMFRKGGSIDSDEWQPDDEPPVQVNFDDYESVREYYEIAKIAQDKGIIKNLSPIDEPDDEGIIGENFEFIYPKDNNVNIRIAYNPGYQMVTMDKDYGHDFYPDEEIDEDDLKSYLETEKFRKGGATKAMAGRKHLYRDDNVILEHNTVSDHYSLRDAKTGSFMAKGGNILSDFKFKGGGKVPDFIWLATTEFFGYDAVAVAKTEKAAQILILKEYKKQRQASIKAGWTPETNFKTFDELNDWFGVWVRKLNIGKSYYGDDSESYKCGGKTSGWKHKMKKGGLIEVGDWVSEKKGNAREIGRASCRERV